MRSHSGPFLIWSPIHLFFFPLTLGCVFLIFPGWSHRYRGRWWQLTLNQSLDKSFKIFTKDSISLLSLRTWRTGVCVCIQICFLSILLKEPFKRRLSWYLFDLCCRLSVRPWDDVLLVSVLKGQNVSGFRKEKGKKDVLVEQISVVLLRTEVLQQQKR